MSKVIRIGGLYDKEERHQAGSIYDQEGLSPNLDTCGGGNRQPLIANDPVLLGGINEMKSNNGRQYYQQDRIYDSESVALCQSANESFNPWYQVEEQAVNERLVETLEKNPLSEDISYIDAYNRQVQSDGTSGTITARINDNNKFISKNLKIRKLTPKECWRLMGSEDEDFDKAKQVNSDSQLYKQAGNSIVVNVLEAIFKEML